MSALSNPFSHAYAAARVSNGKYGLPLARNADKEKEGNAHE